MWLRRTLVLYATFVIIHGAPSDRMGPISEVNADDPEEVEQNYLFSEETRVVHVPLEEEVATMSDSELRHNAKELLLEEDEIRSEMAAGSDLPKLEDEGEEFIVDATAPEVKKDEQGRQAEEGSTATPAVTDSGSSETSAEGSTPTDSSEDPNEQGNNNIPPTESTDELLEKSINELSIDTPLTDQGGTGTPGADDEDRETEDALTGFDPALEDDEDEDETASAGLENANGLQDPLCAGRDDCVFLIQNNQLFGPYFIPDLVMKMGHTEKDVILTVNNQKIPGRMFGPLKAKPRHQSPTGATAATPGDTADVGPINNPLAVIYCSLTQRC